MRSTITHKKLHRAGACISPGCAVASEEVLSLDARRSRTEESSGIYRKDREKSIPARQTEDHGLSNEFKRCRVDTEVAVLSPSCVVASKPNQIKPCQRYGIDQIAFRPAGFLQSCLLRNYIGKRDRNMMLLHDSRSGRTERNHRAKTEFPARLRRDYYHRSPFDHFRNDKSCVVAQQNLAGIGRLVYRHCSFTLTYPIAIASEAKESCYV